MLLFDPALMRNPRMPHDRRVHNHRIVVGRWHIPKTTSEESDWVTDIRSIVHESEQAYWEADCVDPTHWSPMPAPPPTVGWIDVGTLPLAYEYVLLFVPDLSRLRDYPMRAGEETVSLFDMIVGCCIYDETQQTPSWLTDMSEAHVDAEDADAIYSDGTLLWPTHWMQLPSPPLSPIAN